MSAVPALSAIVRPPRTVAARRVLPALLFLGGFLALAFVCGGSANAAERAETSGWSGASSAAYDRLASSAQQGPETAGAVPSADGAPGRTAGDAVRDAGGDALRPGSLRETAAEVVEPLEPVADGARDLTPPAAPVDPAGLGELVEETADLSRPARSDAAASERPRPRNPAGPAAPSGPYGPPGPAADSADARTAAGPTAPADLPGVPQDARSPQGERADGGPEPGDPFPLPRPPVPATAPASATSGDGGPRSGDQHATLASTTPRFGLTAGAVSAASASPTRQRSTDVLEFPG